jgi:hypothetical protein
MNKKAERVFEKLAFDVVDADYNPKDRTVAHQHT